MLWYVKHMQWTHYFGWVLLKRKIVGGGRESETLTYQNGVVSKGVRVGHLLHPTCYWRASDIFFLFFSIVKCVAKQLFFLMMKRGWKSLLTALFLKELRAAAIFFFDYAKNKSQLWVCMYLQIAECKFDKICAGHFVFFDDDLRRRKSQAHTTIMIYIKESRLLLLLPLAWQCSWIAWVEKKRSQVISIPQSSHTLDRYQK